MKTLLLLALTFIAQDPTMTGHTREVSSIAMTANGKLIASGSVDLTVRIWDTATKECLASLEGHDGEVKALAFSPDGKYLASGEMYKKVKTWDTATHKETHMYTDIEGAVTGLVYSTDGKRLFGSSKDSFARVWTIGSPADAKKLAHSYPVNGITISPDGKLLATMDDGGNVSLWNTATLLKSKTLKHASTGNSVAFSADGKLLVSCGDEKIKLWEVATGTEKATLKAEANAAAFTPDGTTIVVGTQDNLVLYLNATDLSLKFKSEKHERPVTGVVISPDGKTAFTSSMDYTLRVWGIK
jgi:WD40 repeat protein